VLGRYTTSGSNDRWLLVANYSRHVQASATITFGSAISSVDTYDPNKDTWKTSTKTTASLSLPAGAAKLLHLHT